MGITEDMVHEREIPELVFPDFVVAPLPMLTHADLDLDFSNTVFKLTDTEMASINAIWERLLDENGGRLLHDGPLVRLKSFEIIDGKPVLEMERTSYRILCGTNLRDPKPEPELCANGIGVCGAIITSDNKMIVGLRSDQVFLSANKLHLIGGNLDPDAHLNAQGVPDPFSGFRTEVSEEIGIEIGLGEISLTGFARNRRTGKPEMTFYSKIDPPSNEITAHGDEHQELLFVDNTGAALEDFLRSNWENVVPVGKAAIVAHLVNLIGEQKTRNMFQDRIIG